MHPFLNHHVYCKDFSSHVFLSFLSLFASGVDNSGHLGTSSRVIFFILYITFSSFFVSVCLKKGGMGYVCTVRQLGLLYFPLYPAFKARQDVCNPLQCLPQSNRMRK